MASEVNQWGLEGVPTITEDELVNLSQAHREHLKTNCAFPVEQMSVERAKVERARSAAATALVNAYCSASPELSAFFLGCLRAAAVASRPRRD